MREGKKKKGGGRVKIKFKSRIDVSERLRKIKNKKGV